ncbi:MAG: alpha/beta fold hydrolase [Gemmatimonadaceae bacterium]
MDTAHSMPHHEPGTPRQFSAVTRRWWIRGTLGATCIVAAILYFAYGYTPKEDRTDHSRYLASIPSRFTTVRGYRLHYIRIGTGPSVVLLPGGGTWTYEYRNIIPSLAERHTVYAIDMPGEGYTQPLTSDPQYNLPSLSRLLGDFLNQEGIARASFVGHSWGGGEALYFAERHPERVEKLVLLDAAGLDVRDIPLWESLKWPVVGEIVSKFITPGLVKQTLQGVVLHKDSVTAEMVRETYVPLTFRSNRKAMYLLERELDWKLTEQALSSVRCPVLIVWGRDDAMLSVDLAQRFARQMTGASVVRVVLVDHAGHSVQEDNPGEVRTAVNSFLR